MDAIISDVVAGVLAEVIVDAGRQIGSATSAMRGRRYSEDSVPHIVKNFLTNPDSVTVSEVMSIVGRYLMSHPQLPWAIGPIDTLPADSWNDANQNADCYPSMTEEAYLGATAILLMTLEPLGVYEGPNHGGCLVI